MCQNLDEMVKKFSLNSETVNSLNRTQKMILYTVLQAIKSSSVKLKNLTDSGFIVGNMLGDQSFADYLIKREALNYLNKDALKNTKFKNDYVNRINELFYSNVSKSNVFPSNLLTGLRDVLNFSDMNFTIDGACSGSLLAIDEAIKLIHSNKITKAIVTGVLGNIGVTGNVAFSKIGALAIEEARPLDKSANGLVPGEGSGTILLEKLSVAEENNHKVYGVIRGSGVASDGSGQAIYAPSVQGQYKAMCKSLTRAHMSIEDVDYIEMHATGTPVGDKVEIKSILKLIGDRQLKKPIRIGSIKHQIGHSFSAAGMANLFKVLLGFSHKIFPPTHGFKELSPEILKMTSKKIEVNNQEREWTEDNVHGRVALVNAFGFGGINANVLVQEYDSSRFLSQKVTSKKDLSEKFSIVGQGAWKDSKESETEFVSNEERFPFVEFKIPPKVVKKIDKSQRVGLIAADMALKSASGELNDVDQSKIGLYVGSMLGLKTAFECDLRIRCEEYKTVLEGYGNEYFTENFRKKLNDKFKSKFESLSEDSLPGFMDNVVAGRISNHLNIKGVNAVIDAGIESFNYALFQGLLSLQSGEYDAVVIGGVNCNNQYEFEELYKEISNFKGKVNIGACFFVLKRTDEVKDKKNVISNIELKSLIENKSKHTTNNYLGATRAFEMLEAVNNGSKVEISYNGGTIECQFKRNESVPKYNTAFFDTYNVTKCLESVHTKKINHSMSEDTKMAIVYTDAESLKNKLVYLQQLIKKESE